jgi:hypothetical protein
MRLAVRKLRIEDIGKLQTIVVENFDAIEPGLTVLDARLLLGHATVDVIGVDAAGTLVLGAVGFTANEEMLLKAVEAYSWCLEYPESLVRLYPSCQVSEDRPPRLLFVVERVPDAFHRKIKQLGFPEVDCVEFRHLEFDGVAGVYFETLLHLRRGVAASRAVEPQSPATAPSTDPATENVIAMAGPAPRPTTMKLQKLLNQGGTEASAPSPRASERTVAPRDPAPVVSMVSRQTAVTARVERPRPAPEPVVLREPEPLVLEPAAEVAAPTMAAAPMSSLDAPIPSVFAALEAEEVTLDGLPELRLESAAPSAEPLLAPVPTPAAESDEPRVSFKGLAPSLLGAAGSSPVPQVIAVAPAVEAPAAPSIFDAPLTFDPLVAALEIAPPPALVAPAEPQIEQVPTLSVEALAVESAPALTVEALVAAAPVSTPVTPQPVAADPAKQLLSALPQEFEGLKFPNDGVLTRQWMEFLNQMSSAK